MNNVTETDNSTFDSESNLDELLFQNSPYCDLDKFTEYFKHNNRYFSVFSLNTQGLSTSFNELLSLVKILENQQTKIDVLCFQECRVQESLSATYQIPGYQMFCTSPTVSGAGGLITYVSDEFSCAAIHIVNDHTNLWEHLFVEISGGDLSKKIILGNTYRATRTLNDLILFIENFRSTYNTLNTNSNEMIILGDFNINLLKIDTYRYYNDFYENLMSD